MFHPFQHGDHKPGTDSERFERGKEKMFCLHRTQQDAVAAQERDRWVKIYLYLLFVLTNHKPRAEREQSLFGEDSFSKAPPFQPDPLPNFISSNGAVVTSHNDNERTLDTNDVTEPT